MTHRPAGLPAFPAAFQKGELGEVEPFLAILRDQMKHFMAHDLEIKTGSGFDPQHLDLVIKKTLKRMVTWPGWSGEATLLCFQLYPLIPDELSAKFSPAK